MLVLGTKKTLEVIHVTKSGFIWRAKEYDLFMNKLEKKKKQAKGASCPNTVTKFYFTYEVINILSRNGLKSCCTRNSFTLSSNTNKIFNPLLSHLTSY